MPWTNAEHILSATNADAEKAELLSLAERGFLLYNAGLGPGAKKIW